MEDHEISSYIEAGEIASQVVAYAKEFIKPKMLLLEIAEKIEAKIEELGGKPAFPTNLSLNEIAAHYTPSSDDKTLAEGILKVDLGVSVDGFIADTAFSLDLTEHKEFEEMITLNERVLQKALEKVEVGSEVSVIGRTISKLVEEYNEENGTNFSIIRNLSGHSLEQDQIHSGLTISNCKNENSVKLEDVAVAIEPFLTTGKGEIYEGKPSEIFMLAKDGNVRDPDARKILQFIADEYGTKPFCKRWLEKESFKKISYSLVVLEKQGIIHNFPVLVEKSRLPVSQAEHTVLITDGIQITTKTNTRRNSKDS